MVSFKSQGSQNAIKNDRELHYSKVVCIVWEVKILAQEEWNYRNGNSMFPGVTWWGTSTSSLQVKISELPSPHMLGILCTSIYWLSRMTYSVHHKSLHLMFEKKRISFNCIKHTRYCGIDRDFFL